MKKPIVLGISAAVILVAGVASFAHYRFGSVGNAVAYLDGWTVRVDKATRDLGTVKCDESLRVTFDLVSMQSEPIEIVGAECSCSCVLPPDMPITLEPFESTPLVLNFHAPPTARKFEEEINLLFNGPLPAMRLRIVGVTQ